jgi:hypothetical protein
MPDGTPKPDKKDYLRNTLEENGTLIATFQVLLTFFLI